MGNHSLKRFRIAQRSYDLYGAMLPTGAVYGNFNNIIYYCNDFKPVVTNGYIHYNVHIYDKTRDKWIHRVCTNSHKKYYKLAEFLCEIFERKEFGDTFKTSNKINRSRNERTLRHEHKIVGAPREKIHQVFSDSPFRANPRALALQGESWSFLTTHSCSNKIPYDDWHGYNR